MLHGTNFPLDRELGEFETMRELAKTFLGSMGVTRAMKVGGLAS